MINFFFPRVWQGSEKKGTLAVQSLRNALMETMLTATVTILIILAMAALTNNTLKVSNLFTSAFFGTQTGKTIVLKYGSASIFLVASFLCSSMALGFLIDANFMVNALGEFSINPRHTETIFERGFTLAFVGDRVLCMTFPLLFWMLGPVPAVVSSLALVWGLRERDFAGNLSRTMSKSCT
ncbi:putative transmembrane protein 87B-like [Capsicum annuum]|nr:putative transmembrane protein 87B-like [Capsicum annuum]KAF3663841.1 putative transmembrane protein 87B-like [Capsicum annuum]